MIQSYITYLLTRIRYNYIAEIYEYFIMQLLYNNKSIHIL